jgi:hypothetical protein
VGNEGTRTVARESVSDLGAVGVRTDALMSRLLENLPPDTTSNCDVGYPVSDAANGSIPLVPERIHRLPLDGVAILQASGPPRPAYGGSSGFAAGRAPGRYGRSNCPRWTGALVVFWDPRSAWARRRGNDDDADRLFSSACPSPALSIHQVTGIAWPVSGNRLSRFRSEGSRPVRYLSDVNLRAVLAVLIAREGGQVDITNEELYDAMLPAEGHADGFLVEETGTGLRLSVRSDSDTDAQD